MNVKEKVKGIFKKDENKNEEAKGMRNWSLKKKVLIGLGVVGASALGVIAFAKKGSEDQVDYNPESDDDEDYDGEESDESEEEENTEAQDGE